MSKEITLSYIDGSLLFDADALLHRYEITIFTSEGEFEGDPSFGMGLGNYIAEPNTALTARSIAAVITAKTEKLFPEIKIMSLQVSRPSIKQINVELIVNLVNYNRQATINKLLDI